MNLQEIYDVGVRGVLKQGCASIDKDIIACQYRGPQKTKCMVGHIIPDSMASAHDLDSMTLEAILAALKARGLIDATVKAVDLRRMQCAHDEAATTDGGFTTDDVFLKRFRQECILAAKDLGLSTAVLDETPA